MGLFSKRNTTTISDKHSVARSVTLTKNAAPTVDRQVVLTKGGVDLTKSYDKAAFSLSKRDLTGIVADVVVLLDHSGSMHNDYANGGVQKLVDRALGFGLNMDRNGAIEVIAFASRLGTETEVTLDNYAGVVDREFSRDPFGTTNMTAAFERVKELAETAVAPLFVVCVTDGAPDDKMSCTRVVCQLASYPVFIKFLAIKRDAFGYLEDLDDLGDDVRLLDNVDAKQIPDPYGMSAAEFADAMIDEFDQWVELAKTAGVLT